MVKISDEIDAAIKREIEPDETIIWSGSPSGAAYARYLLPQAVLGMGGFAFLIVFWNDLECFQLGTCMKAIGFSPGWLYCVALFAGGATLIERFLPICVAGYANSTAYFVTDRRAIIYKNYLFETIESLCPPDFELFDRTIFEDGSGHIIFRREDVAYGESGGHSVEKGFVALVNVAEAEAALGAMLMSAPGLSKKVRSQLRVEAEVSC